MALTKCRRAGPVAGRGAFRRRDATASRR
jgi:hypothetical protein